jgi:hypothetical protein
MLKSLPVSTALEIIPTSKLAAAVIAELRNDSAAQERFDTTPLRLRGFFCCLAK